MSLRRKRLSDLFIKGATVPMPDGSFVWVQSLNAFERDEAISAAQVARSRLVLALKAEGSERLKIEALLVEQGREKFIETLADVLADNKRSDIMSEIEDDPDWAERVRIMHDSNVEDSAKPMEPAEIELLQTITREWLVELQSRSDDEKEFQTRSLSALSDDELVGEYLTQWLDSRGGSLGQAEYGAVEMLSGTRECEVTGASDGHYDHSRCDHNRHVFDGVRDVREAPDGLLALLRDAFVELNMSVRDPKGSASPSNSSEQSPPLSEAGESTASTSTVDPTVHLGI